MSPKSPLRFSIADERPGADQRQPSSVTHTADARLDVFATVSATLGAIALAAAACIAVVGCAPVQGLSPDDVGSMAYPAPLRQGNLATTPVGVGRPSLDTGSMAYPDPVPQGALGTTVAIRRQPFDTGSMAYPEPVPAGSVATVRIP